MRLACATVGATERAQRTVCSWACLGRRHRERMIILALDRPSVVWLNNRPNGRCRICGRRSEGRGCAAPATFQDVGRRCGKPARFQTHSAGSRPVISACWSPATRCDSAKCGARCRVAQERNAKNAPPTRCPPRAVQSLARQQQHAGSLPPQVKDPGFAAACDRTERTQDTHPNPSASVALAVNASAAWCRRVNRRNASACFRRRSTQFLRAPPSDSRTWHCTTPSLTVPPHYIMSPKVVDYGKTGSERPNSTLRSFSRLIG